MCGSACTECRRARKVVVSDVIFGFDELSLASLGVLNVWIG